MPRMYLDTRSGIGVSQAVRLACLYGFDVIILLLHKDCVFVDQALDARSAVGFGKVSQGIIPHDSAELSVLMRGRMSSDDIIITDSCLVAFEALCSGAGAINFWGARYSFETIFDYMEHYWQKREQHFKGKSAYRHGKYSIAARKLFKEELSALAQEKSGRKPVDTPSTTWLPANRGDSPTVYVDADSCFVVPEIVDLCGIANRVSVFVSNISAQPAMTKTLSKAISENEASLVTVMQVPKSKNSADKCISERVCATDIVVCDDLPLTRTCVNKGATVIDSYGRIFKRENDAEVMTLAQIKEIRTLLRPKKKTSKQRRKELFYESLVRLLEAS